MGVQWIWMYHLLHGRDPGSGKQLKGSLIWCFAVCFFYCKVIIKIKIIPRDKFVFKRFHSTSLSYCPIVLTPIECFDQGLMYYPVFPVIQMPPPLVLGKNMGVWNGPLGILLKGFFISRHTLKHVKFLIWWKPINEHLPVWGNCANAYTQLTGRREY